jgi:hypothetical protein
MEGTIEAASRLLDRLLKAAEEGNRMGSVIEILALQAIAHQAQADIPTQSRFWNARWSWPSQKITSASLSTKANQCGVTDGS